MRGTPATSGPGTETNLVILIYFYINWRQGEPSCFLSYGFVWQSGKDGCKSGMFCTCPSNTSHCCSFVRQPSRAKAFHRSPCRNPPSLKVRATKGAWESKQEACRNTKPASLCSLMLTSVHRGGPAYSDPWAGFNFTLLEPICTRRRPTCSGLIVKKKDLMTHLTEERRVISTEVIHLIVPHASCTGASVNWTVSVMEAKSLAIEDKSISISAFFKWAES